MNTLEPAVASVCLDDSVIEQWTVGTLTECAHDAGEKHLSSCAHCRIRFDEHGSESALLELLRSELPEEIASLRRTIEVSAADCAGCEVSVSCDSFPSSPRRKSFGLRSTKKLRDGGRSSRPGTHIVIRSLYGRWRSAREWSFARQIREQPGHCTTRTDQGLAARIQ